MEYRKISTGEPVLIPEEVAINRVETVGNKRFYHTQAVTSEDANWDDALEEWMFINGAGPADKVTNSKGENDE